MPSVCRHAFKSSVVSQFASPDLEADLWLLVAPTMRRADSVQTSPPRDVPSYYSEEPEEGDLQHGETCLRIEPVSGWLRRPHENGAAHARALPSLRRAGAWPDGPHIRSPHVRDHALLGRRPS